MIPQSIAYAHLAGLPTQYGLYTAFIGSLTYVIFGSIKQVSIGPTSLMALLTTSYIEGLSIDYVILLTFLVGCIELIMGIFHLGFIVDFISPCVNAGFTSSMAVVIAVSQMKNVLGVKMAADGLVDTLTQLFARWRDIRIMDSVLGLSCIGILIVLKQLARAKPKSKFYWWLATCRNALIVLITSLIALTLEMCVTNKSYRFSLLGKVPSGLPNFQLPPFSTQENNSTVNFVEMTSKLGSGIVVIPVAAIIANVAIAKIFANDKVVDATREMITLGLCNILGSCVQAMPSTGAFTRSAVANSSGVRSPLQGLFSGGVIILALSFLTPYFYFIPKPSIAAILITAVCSVFDTAIWRPLWHINRFDFCVTLCTFLSGAFFGIDVGLYCGAFINVIILLKLWTRPNIFTEKRIDSDGMDYIYIKPELGLMYPSVDYLRNELTKCHLENRGCTIMLDCANIVHADYTAYLMFKNFKQSLPELILINVNDNVRQVLKDIELNMEMYENTKMKDLC